MIDNRMGAIFDLDGTLFRLHGSMAEKLMRIFLAKEDCCAG